MDEPRKRTGLRTNNVASGLDHDGPEITDLRKDQADKAFYKNENMKNLHGGLQALFFTPLHLPKGNGPNDAPSIGTTIIAVLMTFVACMIHGWIVTTVIQLATTTLFVKGLVPALLFILAALWTRENKLEIHVYFSILFARIGTFQNGFFVWMLFGGVNLAGHVVGGVIAKALGNVTAVPIATTSQGMWLYWACGTFIILTYILIDEYSWRDYGTDQAEYDTRAERVYRQRVGAMAAGIAILTFSIAFNNTTTELPHFDCGLWLAQYISNSTGMVTGVFFLSWAAAATAVALVYGIQLGDYYSDKWNGVNRGHTARQYQSAEHQVTYGINSNSNNKLHL